MKGSWYNSIHYWRIFVTPGSSIARFNCINTSHRLLFFPFFTLLQQEIKIKVSTQPTQTTSTTTTTSTTSTSIPEPRFTQYMAAIDEQYAVLLRELRQNHPSRCSDVESVLAIFQEHEEDEAVGQLWEGEKWKEALTEEGRRMAKKAEARCNAKKDQGIHPLLLLIQLKEGEIEKDEEDEEDWVFQEVMQEVIQEVIQDAEESVREQRPGFRCSYYRCQVQLTHSRLICAKCHKYLFKAGPKPSPDQVAYYCRVDCAFLDWIHRDFHAVSTLWLK